MIPGAQPKFELDKNLNITRNQLEELGILENEFNYRLVRKHDGLTKQSKDVKYIEWNSNLFAKELHRNPEIGYSLIMSPFNKYFTWQTTEIVELIENKPEYIHFKTKNSEYELFKINNNELL